MVFGNQQNNNLYIYSINIMGPVYKKIDTATRQIIVIDRAAYDNLRQTDKAIFGDAFTLVIGKDYIHIPYGHVRHAQPGHQEYYGMPNGYKL